eukprot:763778-Hanusia_phi.AAC.22
MQEGIVDEDLYRNAGSLVDAGKHRRVLISLPARIAYGRLKCDQPNLYPQVDCLGQVCVPFSPLIVSSFLSSPSLPCTFLLDLPVIFATPSLSRLAPGGSSEGLSMLTSTGQTKMREMMKKFLAVTKKPKHVTQNEQVDSLASMLARLTQGCSLLWTTRRSSSTSAEVEATCNCVSP